MEEKLLIDKSTLKAIAVDSRMNILRLLKDKKHTLSEIAELLELRSSTVKEHMDLLVKADLVEKEDTNRKWKYYSLSFKGRRLVEPREVRVMFVFITAFAAAVGVAAVFINRINKIISPEQPLKAQVMMDTMRAESFQQTVEPGFWMRYGTEAVLGIVFFLLMMAGAFLLGQYLKKPAIIINKGDKK